MDNKLQKIDNTPAASLYLDGMMGLIVGDALGNPVQFMGRITLKKRGLVKGMESGGAFHTPAGTWTDDSSMALCIFESLKEKHEVDLDDIMEKFLAWDRRGEYTPLGYAFDQGGTCMEALARYEHSKDAKTCGKTGKYANGNGGLMRTLPLCLYLADRCRNVCTSSDYAIETVHQVTALTHNHLRAKMASGLYYFMVKALLYEEGSLMERLQSGLDRGFAYYRRDLRNLQEMQTYRRLYDLHEFAQVPEEEIKSSGYVVDTLEAAVWSLITTDSLEAALLQAVNLAEDADTTAAVAGGLAGIYYGYDAIPEEWVSAIQRKEWLEAELKSM